MNRTASELPELRSDLPELRPGPISPRVFIPGEPGRRRGHVFNIIELLTDDLIAVPGNITEHRMVQEWNREELSGWVNFDATGATIMIPGTGVLIVGPETYRNLTTHHVAIDAVPFELLETLDELENLRRLRPGWSRYDVATPKTSSILHAKKWIREMYEDIRKLRRTWRKPLVTSDEFGDIVFEWWHRSRKITVYVTPETVEYIKVSGPNMHTDMEDDELRTREDRQDLWQWLMSID